VVEFIEISYLKEEKI